MKAHMANVRAVNYLLRESGAKLPAAAKKSELILDPIQGHGLRQGGQLNFVEFPVIEVVFSGVPGHGAGKSEPLLHQLQETLHSVAEPGQAVQEET